MHLASYFISPNDLWNLIGTPQRRRSSTCAQRDVYDAAPGLLPGASGATSPRSSDGRPNSIATAPSSFACKARPRNEPDAGGALARAKATMPRVLDGGYAAWSEAGLPLVEQGRARPLRAEAAEPMGDAAAAEDRPHRLPLADPALHRPAGAHPVRRSARSPTVAEETGAIPFDIEDVEISHEGERCSFDTMLKLFGLEDEPSLARLALIVRGADTARPDLAPEAAGLHAVSLGLSALAGDDDHGLLRARLHGLRCAVRLAALCRGGTAQLAGQGRVTP